MEEISIHFHPLIKDLSSDACKKVLKLIFSKEKIEFEFKHNKYSPDEMQKVIQQQMKNSKLTL